MGPTSREREYFLRIVWPPCSPDTLRIVVSDGVMKADYIFFSTHVSLLTSLSHTQYRQGRSGRWREVDAMKVGRGRCSSPSVLCVEARSYHFLSPRRISLVTNSAASFIRIIHFSPGRARAWGMAGLGERRAKGCMYLKFVVCGSVSGVA